MSGPAPRAGRVLVVGLGLIGGSVAAALREGGFAGEITGYDQDHACSVRALQRGLVDAAAASLDEALGSAELVVIAVPALGVEQVLVAVRESARADVVITDVASAKGVVLESARRVFGALPPGLVPGHPIAGSERSGVEAARGDLFRGHRAILTPHAGTAPAALALVEAMWICAGAAVTCMEAGEHDRILALTSHLPHVLAFTLVNALSQQDSSEQIFRYAAGGFRDFTRIASSDPVMWRDIALANRDSLLAAIDVFTDSLAGLRASVANSDAAALHGLFASAHGARGRYLQWLEAAQAPPAASSGDDA